MNQELISEQRDALWAAIASLNTPEQCEDFFTDLCTTTELQAMAQRLHVAQLLHRNVVYVDIAAITGASTATITRVNRAFRSGTGGYGLVLDRRP